MMKPEQAPTRGQVIHSPSWNVIRKPSHWDDINSKRRKRAVYMAIFVAIVLAMFISMGVVFSAELTEIDEDENGAEGAEHKQLQCYNAGCNVTCSANPNHRIPFSTIKKLLISSRYSNSCLEESGYDLVIRDAVFANSTLSRGWIGISSIISSLKIMNCVLIFILPGAFLGDQFANTTELVLDSNNITTLPKGAFEGLSSLKYLYILNNRNMKTIHAGVLFHVAQTLQTIRVQNTLSDPDSINHLTGNVKLLMLETVDFSFNSIRKLKNSSFSGLVRPERIYLNVCNLQDIESQVFDIPLHNLKELHLNKNNLTFIPEDLFQSFLNNQISAEIFLSGNPWYCNCQLSWLKNFTESYGPLPSDNHPLVCKSPAWNAGKLITKADFCLEPTVVGLTQDMNSDRLTPAPSGLLLHSNDRAVD